MAMIYRDISRAASKRATLSKIGIKIIFFAAAEIATSRLAPFLAMT
ncbi:MAG: hypothetical protein SPJ19_04570 [Candidatus Borkfalkiaceae bacterium]|nr:hypothetical protein [Christensenellaceae bacterium]